jgi:hypothetical protein
MSKASLSGICACSLFYVLVGNMGYCLIDKLETNFLRSFTYEDILSMGKPVYYIMSIGFLISITFSFPIMFFGARNNFIAVINTILMIRKKRR